MNLRSLVSHLAVGLAAFALAWILFGSHARSPLSAFGKSSDPVARFVDIVAIEDARDRTRALLDFFDSADPAWAIRMREAVDASTSGIVLDEVTETLFAAWWAKSDPAAAFEHRVDPAWTNRNPWIRQVLLAWTPVDPTRAAEMVDTLPPDPDRGRVEAARVLVDHWWDNPQSVNPTPLLAVLQDLEVMPRAGAVQRLLEVSIDRRGIEETEKFVEALKPPPDAIGISVENEIFARFAQALVLRDVDHAVRWAMKHGQGRDGSGVLRHMAFSWGQKDGAAAMEWAMNLPADTMDQAGTLTRVWLSFIQANPAGAEEWLLAHEAAGPLETIYRRFLNNTARTDPRKAVEVASRVKDPAVRESMLASVAAGWLRSDPKAANEWLKTVKLSPEVENRIRQAAAAAGPPVQSSPAQSSGG